MTWRRLGVLLRHLPRESAYAQAVGGEMGRWGEVEHLLASVIDVIQIGNFLTTRAHFKGTPNPPKPLPRPGVKTESSGVGRRKFTIEEMRHKMDHWGEGKVAIETREVT